MKKDKRRAKKMGSILMNDPPVKDHDLDDLMSHQTSQFMQSEKHRELLDIVDRLRSNGVSHYVDLPQIIVCGSQSSGKSSTLKSISGIAFPTADGLCTRFATEMILRRGEEQELKVQIQPSPHRTAAERAKLLQFSEKESKTRSFRDIIEAAKIEMGVGGTGAASKVFSTDVLRIESTSPHAPNLTLVDLPGLFSAGDKNQTDDDSEIVEDLVLSYMNQRRSIILAVISADNPFANQPVTRHTRKLDPNGTRTLGLITKPDKVQRDSDNENYYIDLARNSNVKLNLGWHVLRNHHGRPAADDSLTKREEDEAKFISGSNWEKALEPTQLGVVQLRLRLREALWKHIEASLPSLKYDVQSSIKDCNSLLAQLSVSRSTEMEKRIYLHKISGKVSRMVRAAIDGVYSAPFFASVPGKNEAMNRRLRAKIQQTLAIYAEKMNADGHALEIVEDDLKPVRKSPSQYIMRNLYLKEVKRSMAECRGRELPGTFNPLVVGDLFRRQCKPWVAITQNLAEQVHEAAATLFNKILCEICDNNTRGRLMRGFIQPALYQLRADLKAKLDELLEPHIAIHPITYNEYLTESVQTIQGERHDRAFDDLSVEACGLDEDSAEEVEWSITQVIKLLRTLKNGTRPDVEEYSVSLAADVAAAYYEVALDKFIDDVSVNAVETCLMIKLPEVFNPDVMWDLTSEHIQQLGSEDDSTVTNRAELKDKSEVLDMALKDLDAFTGRSEART